MKSFKEFMSEDGTRGIKSLGGDGGAQNQYGRWGQEPVHMGVHRIEDPNVLQRLNAHVGLVNTREYIDPRSALEHVQNALMRLGYHFDYNIHDMPNEQNVYPLSRFGGRQGFIDMDAEVKEDDGIEASGEKLVLNVEFLQDPDTARYEVLAQIVPADLFDEEEIQPEAIRPNRASVPSTTGDRDGINIGEAVSISMGQEKGQGTFEVQFDFRGGPTRKQAQAFSLAAQKKLAGAQFTPNRKGTSEKVVVTVKASSPRDAQVKARKVLDNVKESIDEAANPKVGQTIAIKGTSGGFAFSKVRNVRGNSVQLENGDTLRQRDLLLVSDLGKGDDDRAILMRKNAAFVDLSIEEVASQIADDVMYEQSLASKAGLSSKALSDKIGKIRREDPDITQRAAAGKAVGILAPKSAKRLFAQNMDEVETFDEARKMEFEPGGPGFGALVAKLDKTKDPKKRARIQAEIDRRKKRFDLGEVVAIRPGQVSMSKGKFIVKVSVGREDFRSGFAADLQNLAKKLKWQVFSNPTRKEITVTLPAVDPRDAQKKVSKAVSQARTEMPEEVISEVAGLARTFAFSTADARDRLKKLLGLTAVGMVSTSNKGKGKFKFTVSASLKGAQIDRIMDSVKQLKGKLAVEQVTEAAALSRTFAFPTADGRDRIEKLLGLAGASGVSTTDKGKGKFKFTVSGAIKGAQIDRILNTVRRVKGKLSENTTRDIANNAVRKAIQERAERLHERDPFRGNQLKVARDTLKMNPVFQKVMGGPSKEEAIKIMLDKGTPADKKLAKRAMNEVSAFGADVLKNARETVKSGLQPVSATARFRSEKAELIVRDAAKFLMRRGTPADKKLAKKALERERVERVVRRIKQEQMNEVVTGHTEFLKAGKHAGTWQVEITFTDEPLKDAADRYFKQVKKAGLDAELKKDFLRTGRSDRVTIWVKLEGPRQSKKEAERKLLSSLRAIDAKRIRFEAKDANEKELERTRKDGKLASAFSEAVADLTVVAIKGNKVVGQLRFVGKKEVKDVVAFMKKEHPGAKVSVENKSGKIISVEGFKEQLSKRKKKAPTASVGY